MKKKTPHHFEVMALPSNKWPQQSVAILGVIEATFKVVYRLSKELCWPSVLLKNFPYFLVLLNFKLRPSCEIALALIKVIFNIIVMKKMKKIQIMKNFHIIISLSNKV